MIRESEEAEEEQVADLDAIALHASRQAELIRRRLLHAVVSEQRVRGHLRGGGERGDERRRAQTGETPQSRQSAVVSAGGRLKLALSSILDVIARQ